MSNVNSPGRPSAGVSSGMSTRPVRHVPTSSDHQPWMDHAACIGMLDWIDLEAPVAKRICKGVPADKATDEIPMRPPCPVINECLSWAQTMRPLPMDGVWGGERARDLRTAVLPKDKTPTGPKPRGVEGPLCGTYRGVRLHRANGELACKTCRDHLTVVRREYRAKRRERAA